jgi:hypothetical protein
MKIIDETGAVVENPDLTLGYLTTSTEEITHPAVEGVEEQWHWETVTEYPNGGKDVQKVIDVPGVPAQAAWTEQVPVQRYIRYTDEELAAQEEARKKAEARKKLPERVDALETANNDIILMMADLIGG